MDSSTETTPESPKPTAPAPVMDVVAPPPQEKNEKQPLAEQLPDEHKGHLEGHEPVSAKPKTPKSPGSGTGLAISATVIIVIVLAGLATFAYLQSK